MKDIFLVISPSDKSLLVQNAKDSSNPLFVLFNQEEQGVDNISCKYPSDYKLSDMIMSADELAKDLADEWYYSKIENASIKEFIYKGVNLKIPIINSLFHYFFRDVSAYYLWLDRVLEMENPKSVIFVNRNNRISKTIIHLLNEKKLNYKFLNLPFIDFLNEEYKSLFNKDVEVKFPIRLAFNLYRMFIGNIKGMKSKSNADIVFLPINPSQVKICNNFLSKLSGKYNIETLKLFGENEYYSYIEPHQFYDIIKYISSLKKILSKSKPLNEGNRLLLSLQNDVIDFLFSYSLPIILFHIERLKFISELKKPRLFLVMEDVGTFGKIVAEFCNAYNIKSLDVQHGAVGDIPWFENMVFTKIAVFGEDSKSALIRRGVSPDRIVITGASHYDRIFNSKFKSKSEVAKDFGFSADKKIIVFASQPLKGLNTYNVKKNTIDSIIHSISQLDDCQLIIKLHPLENDVITDELINRKDFPITKDYDLYDLLSACDLVITSWSTVSLEALLFDKPVMLVNLTGQPDMIPFVKDGSAYGVYNQDDILPAIKKLLYDEDTRNKLASGRRRLMERYLYKCDGKSSERVAELIESLIVSQ